MQNLGSGECDLLFSTRRRLSMANVNLAEESFDSVIVSFLERRSEARKGVVAAEAATLLRSMSGLDRVDLARTGTEKTEFVGEEGELDWREDLHSQGGEDGEIRGLFRVRTVFTQVSGDEDAFSLLTRHRADLFHPTQL